MNIRIIALLASFLFSGVASATIIDFASMASGSAGTGTSEVSWYLEGGVDTGAPYIINGRGMVNSISSSYPTADVLAYDFNGTVDSFVLDFNNQGSNSQVTGERGASYYQAFDSLGNLLAENWLITGLIELSMSGISLLELHNSPGAAEWDSWIFDVKSLEYTGYDNTSVSAVPVPAAAWLFGSALLGFFGFSRRKANA